MNEHVKKVGMVRQHLLDGVSYVIPFVASGGILIAIAIALAPMTATGPDFESVPLVKMIFDIGTAIFSLLIPVLGGYIAYSMAGRPGLVPGFLGGLIASQIGSGFLGGLVAGLLAGLIVLVIKKIKVPTHFKPLMKILVIPVISSLIVGFIMFKVLGFPIKGLMDILDGWLRGIGTENKILLGAILGAMIAFDMGGPINKVAYFFGAAMVQKGIFCVMGACAAAICIPPLGLGLATLVNRRLWNDQEKEAGYAALAMGVFGITEGAIPFAAGDPLRVIPTIIFGSMIGSIIAMVGGVGGHAPHGGLVVLPVVDHKLIFLISIAVGAVVIAVTITVLKKLSNGK